ncbi:hypothetical protein K1719_047200 [Acacia pycnantha]|nr:hypothetical protein K1719_047200 [Acacia pycnantha]
MVHGILQFTPSIAFRYVLHRCESRDIRCRESFRMHIFKWQEARRWEIGAVPGPPASAPRFHFCSLAPRAPGFRLPGEASGAPSPSPPYRRCSFQPVRGSLFLRGHDNDPSAGSPTETLLRLLLPLNDKVRWTSRDVAGSEPPTSPRSEHFTGPFNR